MHTELTRNLSVSVVSYEIVETLEMFDNGAT